MPNLMTAKIISIIISLAVSSNVLGSCDVYIAKANTVGAVNKEILNEIDGSYRSQKLMIDKGLAYLIKQGQRVCATGEHSWQWYKMRVYVPEQKLAYWVSDTAFVKVE